MYTYIEQHRNYIQYPVINYIYIYMEKIPKKDLYICIAESLSGT